ncbi:probable serine/threonine-protein kinase SIS8 [Olea europaea var. sylvestris]|uniref:probable serine/threonine-protein kinase SIS8 n=1 Tax=Olea europaea var. sylvestris TaxID=158386 RepID=UPI000C1D5E1C|nr:probable serine/threonine-protein kinase SIS8 [Olea europaea var. sylvestris]XP_022892736.1 probable serine/threonine-protein kinase SIS8 [Olea europaea var. sylvestris]XP_022892737.1 probable serine/threonine-protein kinase SIS8 [Olea europaea var. sylvestris]
MSKVKHLLRKLHIGDHQHQDRPPVLDPSPQTTPSHSSLPSSPSSDPHPILAQPAPDSLENENSVSNSNSNSNSDSNFNFFEEEFQVQLALAISVSDPGQNHDPETAQINVAKQISLGCSPTQSLAEFLSLRYWSYNAINYDEKVIDGFYDICGFDSNLLSQAKMPSLVDLQLISVLDHVGSEVVLVNRTLDTELREFEEKVYCMSVECLALERGTSFLVQKIADLIVNRMGGPVNDAEEMFKRWKARSYDLQIFLNAIILPLGCLDVGDSRQRALLFKVLADRINLPCKLVKGSYYTGTDEGAVNLIRLDNGSEYIVDLMGAPGTLIPAEVPSSHQNFSLDARSITHVVGTTKSSCITFDEGAGRSLMPNNDETFKIKSSSSESSSIFPKSKRNGRAIALSLCGVCEESAGAGPKASARQKLQVEDVSKCVIDAARDPEFAGKLHAVLSENYGTSNPDVLLSMNSHDNGEDKLFTKNESVRGERVIDTWRHPEMFLSKKENAPQQIFSKVLCDSSKIHTAEGLAAQQLKPDPAVSNPGYNVSSNTPAEGFTLFKGRTDEVIHDDDIAVGAGCANLSGKIDKSSVEVTAVAYSNQSSTSKNQKMKNDPVLSGVAEILWEDLQIGERIGIGSYGEVYRAEWNGTEVAVKKFMNQDISGVALAQFRCEVEIMLRLRHPNVVLFMGAVTRPPNLSILTEFLPRGSLFKLLHRLNIQIEEKRRIKMALDVARGMNYLHTSHPIIVHRDLKTPNLLVDKNWVVKVCDFGMSRLQHSTFLSSKSAAGTAEWMAPEVLRNEQSNEKSDVYSFGVILWELATLRVPWMEMNSMQVVGAVGFQGRHLEILPTIDPMVAEIISDCWNR